MDRVNLARKIFRLSLRIKRIFYTSYNIFKFKSCGVKFGDNLRVYNRLNLHLENNSHIVCGDNLLISSGIGINPLSKAQIATIYCESGAIIEIGDNVGMSSPCLWSKRCIKIGNNVKIGADCILLDTDCHCIDWRIRQSDDTINNKRKDAFLAKSSPIVIEDDVLIGTRAIILKGVTIGARSIVAAGSVVTKSFPSDTLIAGNPAKSIKKLSI